MCFGSNEIKKFCGGAGGGERERVGGGVRKLEQFFGVNFWKQELSQNFKDVNKRSKVIKVLNMGFYGQDRNRILVFDIGKFFCLVIYF